jgi:4-aminobutyrate aminotransferase
METSTALAKHKKYLFPALTPYYQEPIALERGDGNYVWDDTGKRYLDAFGGVLTVSVGHANPKVVAAIVDQVKKISHTSTLYASGPQGDYAEKLAATTPGNLKKSFFTSSGTEANETAMPPAGWNWWCCGTATADEVPRP